MFLKNYMKIQQNLREQLAAIEHDQWMQWSQTIAQNEQLSEERLARWKKLWVPYAELSEKDKDSDREWADKVLAKFDAMLAEDIEKMKERIKSNHLGISFDYGVEECIDYLEARRLSIKE